MGKDIGFTIYIDIHFIISGYKYLKIISREKKSIFILYLFYFIGSGCLFNTEEFLATTAKI